MLGRKIILEAEQEREEFWLKTEEAPEDSLHFLNQSFLYEHRDHLCMELTINGEPIFLRSGIIIDQKFMDKEDTSRRDRQPYMLKSNCAFLQLNCTAYMNQKEGVLVKRKIVAIASRLFVLMDEFYAVGLHTYEQMFQFPKNGRLSISSNRVHYEGEKVCTDMYYMSGNMSTDGSIRIVPGGLEVGPGERRDAVLVTREGSSFRSLLSVIHCYDKEAGGGGLEVRKLVPESFKGGTMNDQQVEALEITLGEKRYIVSISHLDVLENADLFRVGDCNGFGNVLVFDAASEEKRPIVLR